MKGKKEKVLEEVYHGYDLHEALMNCSTYIEKFGGHSMAIGITVKKKDFENFKQEFEEYSKSCHISDIIPIIDIDKEIDLKQIDIQIVKSLELLEPFGEANKVPIFLLKNLKIEAIRSLSEGKHLKLKLGQEGYLIDAIGFHKGEEVQKYQIGDKVDVVGSLEVNSFNGNDQIQINLKDLRKSML